MFRFPIKATVIPSSSLISLLYGDKDDVLKNTKTSQTVDLTIGKAETGQDRLRRMFTRDEFETLSPEVATILNVTYMSVFVGAVYGGVMSSRTAYTDFMKNNQASLFTSHWEAKKKLQDKVTISFGKGAFRWSWRLTLFSTSYIGLSTCISVYRGKDGIIEHCLAGTISGTLYKFSMGPKGWIVGGLLGLALGTVAGCTTYGLLKLTGISMDEIRYWQYHWKEKGRDNYKEAIDRIEKDKLLLHHEEKHGESAKTLDNLNVNKV